MSAFIFINIRFLVLISNKYLYRSIKLANLWRVLLFHASQFPGTFVALYGYSA